MGQLPRLSIRVSGSIPPAACVRQAENAEAAGLSGVWFAENAYARGILPAAAACAVASSRLQINVGVFNPFTRHPTMMAMEVGALDELSNGRASLSIGTGIISALQKIGAAPEKPLVALRDAVAIARALLGGEEVDYAGPVFRARKVQLGYSPRTDISIFMAGRGNLMVKLAGEIADGLLVSNMCSIAFAGRLAAMLQAARRTAGRNGLAQVVQYMPCAVDVERDAALAAAKRAVGDMLPGFWSLGQKLKSAKEGLLAGTNITEDEFATSSARLSEGEDAVTVLDERYTRAFALAGTPEDCLAAAERYAEAGVSELALTFPGRTALKEINSLGAAAAAYHRTHG